MLHAKHCRVLSWTMALAQSNSNTVNHEQTTTRDIGKSQEPRTTWWSLDFLRHKLSPASSEGLGRTWQNLQPEKYRESIVSAVQSLPYDWRKSYGALWCIIIRDVCAIASSPKMPPKTWGCGSSASIVLVTRHPDFVSWKRRNRFLD